MDKCLQTLCDALKKIFSQFKSQSTSVSFIIVTGKANQGKTTLLRQSHLTPNVIELEHGANIFHSQEGVILELGETWLMESQSLLHDTLKQLNRCHKFIRISGIILCVNSDDLLILEPLQLMDLCKSHAQILYRFGHALNYRIDAAIILTKLDSLAGFCEFFQSEHINDSHKPLGFSLQNILQHQKLISNYKWQFDQMIEMLGQQIINKLHPARSSIQRTLIREFPLQLASLCLPIQTLVQHIPPHIFRLQAIYFTSSEQGGLSIDKLNKKIQNEYALTVQDRFPQSRNYRTYFIEGALRAFQQQTQQQVKQINITHKIGLSISTTLAALILTFLGFRYFQTSKLLDETSKELLTYETIITQTNDKTSALYHLSLAEEKLKLIPKGIFSVPYIEQLKSQLQINTQIKIKENFFPDLIHTLEDVINQPSQTPFARYQALKIYLMFGDPQYFSSNEITHWFSNYWRQTNMYRLNDKPLIVLKNALKLPFQPMTIDHQLVTDTRNFLNALPSAYLFYSLAKNYFPEEKISINVKGFDLPSKEFPMYFTKNGFKQIVALLPSITTKLQQENWVLARQDLINLHEQLEEAYCYDYIAWWQNFIHRTRPQHYQGYQQAIQLMMGFHQTNSINQLIHFLQQQTGPDLADKTNLFNLKIAPKFTLLSLLSNSASNELTQTINELEKFLTTLSLVKDNGLTVFNLTKARFQGNNQADPLSVLYIKSNQLPEPISNWAKQIADDTWFIFINQSKDFINKKWQHDVYSFYQSTIANRYPFDTIQRNEVALADFNEFFSPHGILNEFVAQYLKPFLDTSQPEWQPKALNGYILPISANIINELIRANVISNMFFPNQTNTSKIEFSLQKINLDPLVANLQLVLGKTTLTDNQDSNSYTYFTWPEMDAKLSINSIEGKHVELSETGPWAFFKMLQKVNVLMDNNDSASLQILFEVSGNSGRYLLKTQNQINPFSPGILAGFNLDRTTA